MLRAISFSLVSLALLLLPEWSWAAEELQNLGLTGTQRGIYAVLIFIIAYAFVMTEEYSHLRKSKPVILAAGIIWALQTYEFVKLPSTVYYLDHLPVRAEWSDWWKTIVAALAITLGATVYPAWQAARLAPVDALRYE